MMELIQLIITDMPVHLVVAEFCVVDNIRI